MARAITFTGTGLHSGQAAEVVLERTDRPLAFVTPDGRATLAELTTLRTDRGVRVACPRIGLDVDGVEHFCAALGGLGIRHGLDVRVQGGELPLLDGAALEFCKGLLAMECGEGAPTLAVVRGAELRHGDSVYRFATSAGTELHVDVSFAGEHLGCQSAFWNGTRDAFVSDIAWARTFGFVHEAEALSRAGRARGVSPLSVLILDHDGTPHPECPPPRPEELARHKLLDLVGDLYLKGGPPRGVIRAERPGHTATRAVFEEARQRGIVDVVAG